MLNHWREGLQPPPQGPFVGRWGIIRDVCAGAKEKGGKVTAGLRLPARRVCEKSDRRQGACRLHCKIYSKFYENKLLTFNLKKMICDTLILEQINNRYTGLDKA